MQAATKPVSPTRLATRTVPLKSLKVSVDRFSPRRFEGDGAKAGLARADSGRHAKDLADALRHGAKFDPLLAWADPDGQLWLVDGFHRYQAYKEVGRTKAPVRVMPADTPEAAAHLAAYEANHKNKLPMTKGQRMEAVWRLIATRNHLVEAMSARQAGEHLGVGKSTIGRMRQARVALETAGDLPAHEDDMPTWWQATNREWGDDDWDETREREREERRVNELANALEAVMREHWVDDAQLLEVAVGMATERVYPAWKLGEDDEDLDSEDY